MSRRRLLGAAGAGPRSPGVGAAARASLGTEPQPVAAPDGVVPFRGTHQAGIITPAQDRLHFVALDVTTTDRAAVQGPAAASGRAAAERMTAGAEATPGGAVSLQPGGAADGHR